VDTVEFELSPDTIAILNGLVDKRIDHEQNAIDRYAMSGALRIALAAVQMDVYGRYVKAHGSDTYLRGYVDSVIRMHLERALQSRLCQCPWHTQDDPCQYHYPADARVTMDGHKLCGPCAGPSGTQCPPF
jgi:hypothetical protein